MKKLIFIFLVFFSLMCSVNANSLSSGPFYFADGTIYPKKQNGCTMNEKDCDMKIGRLIIPLLGLETGITYKVTCDIENPNFNKSYPVVIKVIGGSLLGVTSPSNQYLLDHLISEDKTNKADLLT